MFRYSVVKVLFQEKMFLNGSTSGRSISRILSSGFLRLCDHLSGRRVTAPLNATYPGLTVSPCETALMKTSRLPPSADGFVPTWSCSQRGLPGHLHYCKCRWSFTPPFHHHLLSSLRSSPNGRGVGVRGLSVSVALIRQVNSSRRCSPPRVLSDAVLYGVRTFLDPDNAEPRSPNRPEATSSYTQGMRASTATSKVSNGLIFFNDKGDKGSQRKKTNKQQDLR